MVLNHPLFLLTSNNSFPVSSIWHKNKSLNSFWSGLSNSIDWTSYNNSNRFEKNNQLQWLNLLNQNSQYHPDLNIPSQLSSVQIHPSEEWLQPQAHWINPGTFFALPLPPRPGHPTPILWIQCWTQIAHQSNAPYSVFIRSEIVQSPQELWNNLEQNILPLITHLDDPVNLTLPLYSLNHPILMDLWEQQNIFNAQEWDSNDTNNSTSQITYWTYFHNPVHSNQYTEESSLNSLTTLYNNNTWRLRTLNSSLIQQLSYPIEHWFQLQSTHALWTESQTHHLLAAQELGTLHSNARAQQTSRWTSLSTESEGSLSHPQWSSAPKTPWENFLYQPPYQWVPLQNDLQSSEVNNFSENSPNAWSLSSHYWQPYHLLNENNSTLTFTPRDEFLYRHVYNGTLAGRYRYPLGYPLDQNWFSEDPEQFSPETPVLPLWRWSAIEERKSVSYPSSLSISQTQESLIIPNPDLFRRAHLYFPENELYLNYLLEQSQTTEPIHFQYPNNLHFIRTLNLLDDPLHSLYHWILQQHQTLNEDILQTLEKTWPEWTIPNWASLSYSMHELQTITHLIETQNLLNWASFYQTNILTQEFNPVQNWFQNLEDHNTPQVFYPNEISRNISSSSFQEHNLSQSLLYFQSNNLQSTSEENLSCFSLFNLESNINYWIWTSLEFIWENPLQSTNGEAQKETYPLSGLQETDQNLLEWRQGNFQSGNILSREQTPSSRFPVTWTETTLENQILNLNGNENSSLRNQNPALQSNLQQLPWTWATHLLNLPSTELQNFLSNQETSKNAYPQEPSWLYLWDTSYDLQNWIQDSPLPILSWNQQLISNKISLSQSTYNDWLQKIPLLSTQQNLNLPIPVTPNLFNHWDMDYQQWHSCLHPNHPLQSFKNAPQFDSPTFIQEIIDRLYDLDLPWTESILQEKLSDIESTSTWNEQFFHPSIFQNKNLSSLKNWCEQAVLLVTLSMASLEITSVQSHNISLWSSNSIAPFLQEGGTENDLEEIMLQSLSQEINFDHETPS